MNNENNNNNNNNNNNENEENIIIVTSNIIEKYPYFQAMRSFHNLPKNKNLILHRNTSGFSNKEFDALKKILEIGTTENYALAEFFKNYLGANENTNYYDPLVIQRVLPVKKGRYNRTVGKKQKQRWRRYARNENENNNLFDKATRKLKVKEEIMKILLAQKLNELEKMKHTLGNNRAHEALGHHARATATYSKYGKSKRPSTTSRTTRKHELNRIIRNLTRRAARENKSRVHEEN
jgi:hypothetical protein